MMFGDGTGSEMRKPLGYSMVGGLALSQILTLYTTPVVYLYLARLQVWMRGKSEPADASGRGNPSLSQRSERALTLSAAA